MNSFTLTISTPEGNAFSGQAEGLFLRGACGDLAVLAGHAPFVTYVMPGELHIDIPAESAGGDALNSIKTLRGKISGGLLNVAKEGAVLITPSITLTAGHTDEAAGEPRSESSDGAAGSGETGGVTRSSGLA